MKKSFLILMVCVLASCSLPSTAPPVEVSPSPTFTASVPAPTSTFTPAPTPTPRPPESVTYRLLRIEYSTTSDWATLDLSMVESVLAVRVVEVQGEPTHQEAGPGRLVLNQPLAESEAGRRVGLVLEYAVTPDLFERTIQLDSKKGNLGSATIKLYGLAEGELKPIHSFDHSGVVPDSEGLNTRVFEADLTPLQNTAQITTSIQRESRQKMVWAFYYMWYAPGDWFSGWLKDLPPKKYNSDSRETIALQVEQAQGAGIDGFISSWWGPGSQTDRNLQSLLEIAQEKDFKVSIYFETLAGPDGAPLDEAGIREWLAYFIRTYRDHPAYMNVNGKPVVMLWASENVPLKTWERVFASLRDEGLDAVYLGMSYSVAYLGVFDGLHDYGVFTYPDLKETYLSTARGIRYFPLLSDQPVSKIWAATVQPGYDDTLLPDRAGLVQERLDGDFYSSTWEAAIASDPDWIFITSWNEWWEHTHIEPGELHGDLYLQITREYADRWKSR